MQQYAITDFEKQVSAMKPRFIDIWVLPPLVMYSAYKSRDLGRWTRRVLFTAGIYMMYRSFTEYKNAASMLTGVVAPAITEVVS